jgi:hypothetical protein
MMLSSSLSPLLPPVRSREVAKREPASFFHGVQRACTV